MPMPPLRAQRLSEYPAGLRNARLGTGTQRDAALEQIPSRLATAIHQSWLCGEVVGRQAPASERGVSDVRVLQREARHLRLVNVVLTGLGASRGDEDRAGWKAHCSRRTERGQARPRSSKPLCDSMTTVRSKGRASDARGDPPRRHRGDRALWLIEPEDSAFIRVPAGSETPRWLIARKRLSGEREWDLRPRMRRDRAQRKRLLERIEGIRQKPWVAALDRAEEVTFQAETLDELIGGLPGDVGDLPSQTRQGLRTDCRRAGGCWRASPEDARSLVRACGRWPPTKRPQRTQLR